MSFSLLGLQHPEPNGSRRATPTSTFQHRPGHPPEEFPDSAWLSALTGSNYTEYEPTDFAKAAEWLDKAIRLSPNERNIIAALATTYDKAFGVEDARRRHEQLAEEFPDSAWLAEVTARSYGGGDPNDFASAAEWHQKAFRLENQDLEIVNNLAIALRASLGVEETRKRLEQLAEEFPDSAWLAAVTGSNYTEHEPTDFAKASEWFDKAVRLSPNERDIIAALPAAYDKAYGVEETRKRLEQLAEEFPDSGWLAAVTGSNYTEHEPTDFAKASEWFDKAVRLSPNERDIIAALPAAYDKAYGVAARTTRRRVP